MVKAKKLKICNWSLLVATAVVLASSVQLEATYSRGMMWVFIHISVASVFVALAIWHIYLNISGGNWFVKFKKQKSPVTSILWWFLIFTVLSAIIALVHWLGTYSHSPVGGVHGKIGFVMIAIAIGHTIKRFKFFRPRKKNLTVSSVSVLI